MKKFTAIVLGLLLFFTATSAVAKEDVDKTNNKGNNNGIPQQLESLQTELDSIYKTLQEQQIMITNLHTEKDELKTIINNQNDQITKLQVTVESQQQKIQDLQDQINTEGQRIDGNEQEISSLIQYFESLERKVNDLWYEKVPEIKQLISHEAERLEGLIMNFHSDDQDNHNDDEEGFTISGNMVDSNGNPFFTGLYLMGENGERYSISQGEPDGFYRFENIPNGTYQIHYYYSNYAIASGGVIDVNNQDISGHNIQLAVPTYSVSGIIKRADGTPFSNYEINLEDEHNIGSYYGWWTENNGEFILNGVAPGTYNLTIRDEGSRDIMVERQITVNDQNITGIEIFSEQQVDEETYNIMGTVLDSEGNEIKTPVFLKGLEVPYKYEGNQFFIENVAPGTYKIGFKSEAYQQINANPNKTITVTDSNLTNVTLQLTEPTYSVTGQVFFSDGSPMANTKVMIRDSYGMGWGGYIYTNSKGYFTINGLPNGEFQIELGQPHNVIAEESILIQDSDINGLNIQQ